ncbi:MAG: double-strand break repair helicase AddA [Pseudolabrys sp.]|nr:double-strand break repair helicase AddA [Pseudolabrys sp.]
MNAPRNIPSDVTNVQIEAASPDTSAFVSANAGSGKTHVLAQRVINLLLRGTDPAKILCITFTKAAAANMANRVFGTLAEWSTLSDTALDDKIKASTGKEATPQERARARRLFASALETPGGLKVQTIHAFCTRLLHQFPFEANVAARFTVLDEAQTTELLDRLTLDVLLEASAAPQSPLGKALSTAIVVAADQTFKDVIGDAIKERDAISKWIDAAGSVDAAINALSHSFGVDPKDTAESLEHEFFAQMHIPETEWADLISVLEVGTKSDKNHIEALVAAQKSFGRDRIENYLDIFCNKDDARTRRQRLLTKALAADHPDWFERLTNEQGRVCALIARERAVAARDRTRALITIAADVIGRYKAEKDRRALLDYDDLIDKTIALFERSSAAWVLYKLDLGIDHVLVDEAQDTSPKQWTIIRTIVSEFMPGGARPNIRRTVFAVGDEKQSIFSFQGAEPREFDNMRRVFERQFNRPELGWKSLKFHSSFRSGENVLGAVDQVFRDKDVYSSITTDEIGIPEHRSLPDAAPGLVEVWPLVEPAERKEMEGWDAPFDTESEESPRVRLARRIATNVKLWMSRGLKAGDVLVLVRQRGQLFEAIIRAMKMAGVPVAGADRLVLTEHIAVMDLMALADALLLPDDDLALASVLKSPLFGLNEEQLFELAYDRKGSLRASLRGNAAFSATAATLDELSDAARNLTPFAFFAHVLGPLRGRAKVLARLGPEANDALDEFLNLALTYEVQRTPSLQGFVNWLRAAQSEVRRDMELARDEVRVMTVHGAKGLEANTVILADTVGKPTGKSDPRLLPLQDGAITWAKGQKEDIGPMTEARLGAQQDARNEYRRLLYVGMTRAAERLIVCGAKGANKIPDGCWYQLVDNALTENVMTEPADDGDGEVKRYRKGEALPPPEAKQDDTKPAAPPALPDWLTRDAPREQFAARTVTPSGLLEDDERFNTNGGGNEQGLLRGKLVHRLMQSLPNMPVETRRKAADDYLARSKLEVEERPKLAAQVMAVIDDTRFSDLFGPGSRAEVPIVGRLKTAGQTLLVSGQVDRLVITNNAILIGDYKTNRPAPRTLDEVPPAYVRQLALYRAVLAQLYPDRPIRAALIWTEVPDLMELSAETLDTALTLVTSAR